MSAEKTELSQIFEDLVAIGFSVHEARVYVALVIVGPATAYELAKKASIPVPNTYNVIRALSARGAATKVSSRPGRYVATPPSELLKAFATKVSEKCKTLVSRFEKMEPPRTESFVEVLTSTASIDNKIVQLVRGAKKQILVKGYARLSGRIDAELVAAAKRNVQILYVYYGDTPPELPKGSDSWLWPHEGNGAQFGPNFFAICADYQSALIRSLGKNDEGAYSENHSFVYLAGVFLRHEIYLAEIMRACGDVVEAEFGPALYKIRRQFGLSPLAHELRDFASQRLAAQGRTLADLDLAMETADAR